MNALGRARRIRACITAALCAVAAGAACNRGGSEKPVVGLVLKTLNNAFFVEMEKGARSVADSLGLDLLVQAPEREVDVEKQMQIVENLIQRRIAVLAISPSGSREIVPAIVKAGAAKIPVVVVDTRVDEAALTAAGGSVATFIGSDNADGGRIAGQFIVGRLAGKGRVAVLEGIPGHESGDSRLRGFREAVAQSPGIDVVSSQTANWERDQAFNVTQNMLQSHPDLQAIFACNDVMALGAVEAIAAAGLQGKIIVVGFDAQDDARAAVDAGRMAATIAQSPFAMGRLAMISASRLLKGETVPAQQPVTIQLVTAKAAARAMIRPVTNRAVAMDVADAMDVTDAQSVTLRVMTYNIAAGGGDLARVERTIRESGADVIAVQEVDIAWSPRSRFADQPALLAKALGMEVRFAPIYVVENAGHTPSAQFGVALLSRFPIVGFRNHDLTRLSTQAPGAAASPAPGFLEATINVRGTRLRVFNTHLDYRADPAVRVTQVREMLAILGASRAATLLAGDLNATPEAPELQPLFITLHDLWPASAGQGLSYPSAAPSKRIDYLLASSGIRATSVRTVESDASDHRPVVADLVLNVP